MEVGTELDGRYVVEAPISSGAMGAVFLALDQRSGDQVAVKRLIDLSQIARFEIEARLLSQLEHPRVVKVVDHFREDDGYFLVMELVRGQDLDQVLKSEGDPGLAVLRVLEHAHETCEALHYVHQQGIVHRDVKPQNLILCDRGVVLVDFGVARELLDETEAGGTIGVGTPRFMAPEIFAGGAVSERSDVFSLATTATTLIAGQLPSYGDRTGLRERFPDVTPEVDEALRRGMEFMPERRIATVAAFANALGRPISGLEGSSLARSVEGAEGGPPSLMEAVVRTAAGVFDAAAASIALVEELTGELVYRAAWGAGAHEIVGVRLAPSQGISGAVVASAEPTFVADCRHDERFEAAVAAGTGYVPITMLVVPLLRGNQTIGALSLLDRRDGNPYGASDVSRAMLFAELAVAALEHGVDALAGADGLAEE
ncbi:MAG: eukaryotic-like serine/threonine-protein kinase [Solirubrobacteraceae bacterium]|nr:eukaryotic-like serine/threonine-protein kinase [Solirubrobacteraceae bacterium]